MRRPSLRRSRDPKLDRLATVHLFEGCTAGDLKRIAALSVELDVPAGRVLTHEGQSGHEVFVIQEGTAVASVPGRDPVRVGPGECVGELALLERVPRSATVRAESAMKVLVLDSREFAALMDEVPRVAASVRAAATRRRSADSA